MAPHRPRKSAPKEYATDEEDVITYDVEEEELEPDPTVRFTIKEAYKCNLTKPSNALHPRRTLDICSDGRSPVPRDCNCNFYICPVVVYNERNLLGASLTPPKRVTRSHAWKKALHP
ncbi:hypothetical protein TNCV_4868581 [Trichonephila clavipes]|nr:hypothetical protein TNCV_4868581 [Trichonephila clavipes]